jgi:hypothetical protein
MYFVRKVDVDRLEVVEARASRRKQSPGRKGLQTFNSAEKSDFLLACQFSPELRH